MRPATTSCVGSLARGGAPWRCQRVRMARVDDVRTNDEPSASALLSIPTGRIATTIMAFTKGKSFNIKIAGERAALTDETIIAASTSDKRRAHNHHEENIDKRRC